MSAAPYNEDTPALLTRSLGQVVRAWLLPADSTPPIPLELERCVFGWDEGRAPRCTASLTARVPTDQSVLDLFDPRLGARVAIHAGYVRPGGTQDVQPVADLGLRSRLVTRPDNSLDLTAAGDEALVIDGSPVDGWTYSGASHTDVMTTLLRGVIPATDLTVTGPTGAALTVADLTDVWATVDDLADRINADVYDDGTRAWQICPRPTLAGTPAHTLTVGQDGTLITSSSGLDRVGWFNAVMLRYRWRDGDDVDQEVTSTRLVTAGPYAYTGPSGRRTYTEDRAVPTNQSSADAAADAILTRFLSRARSYQLRALAAYWLRPGMTITVQLPLGDPESHLVSSVTFDGVAGTMDVKTRLPDNASTIGGS